VLVAVRRRRDWEPGLPNKTNAMFTIVPRVTAPTLDRTADRFVWPRSRPYLARVPPVGEAYQYEVALSFA